MTCNVKKEEEAKRHRVLILFWKLWPLLTLSEGVWIPYEKAVDGLCLGFYKMRVKKNSLSVSFL